MDQGLDEALTAGATRLGTTDAARIALGPDLDHLDDPGDGLIGCLDIKPDEDLDSVIYELDS